MAKQLFMFVGLMQREPIKKMQKVSQGEMAMLGFLTYEKSETNPKELSERFNLSTARVANTLNSLERKEYITRVHDSFDRRKVMVYITEKGKEVGIQEEERQGKYGRKYYALIHTRESQEMILGELRDYLSNLQGE